MIISVLNLKGGVSKSTTCVNMAAALAELSIPAHLFDLDYGQPTLSSRFARAVKGVKCEKPDRARLQKILMEPHDGHLIFDFPPRLSPHEVEPIMVLLHADILLVPVEAAPEAFDGATSVLELMDTLVGDRNEKLDPLFFLTMFSAREPVCREVKKMMQRAFRDHLLQTAVPHSIKFKEAAQEGQALVNHLPQHPGAKAYRKLTQEILDHGNQ